MGGDQVRQTADMILEDYSHFKPEDFKLCFSRAKKGHYGKLYDRLDGQIIMGWLMDYDNERDGEIEVIRAKDNRQLKQATIAVVGAPDKDDADDRFADNFAKNMPLLQSKLAASKLAREKIKESHQVNYDPIYVKSQHWLAQFDLIWKRQGYPKSRLIRRYGMIYNPFYKPDSTEPHRIQKRIHRKIDINQYLEHKHWQYGLAMLPANQRKNYYLTKYPKK